MTPEQIERFLSDRYSVFRPQPSTSDALIEIMRLQKENEYLRGMIQTLIDGLDELSGAKGKP